MANFNDNVTAIKESLKALLNADNTETVTALDRQVDELVSAYTEQSRALADAKDTLIEYVKNTSFNAPAPAPMKNEPRDLDDVISDVLKKYEK